MTEPRLEIEVDNAAKTHRRIYNPYECTEGKTIRLDEQGNRVGEIISQQPELLRRFTSFAGSTR